ncbi:MAG: ornithine cyclodeaminase family protein [Solirubrobacterales bacterium]
MSERAEQGQTLWIGEAEVVELLGVEEAIDVLQTAYRLRSQGLAESMRRAHVREGDAILHAVGGTIAGRGLAGTKTWLYTPGGASPLLILFSLGDGSVLAAIEAFAMGQMRTSATTGLATRVMANPDAETLALLGTGKQAFSQAQAVSCVRPIREIRLFGRRVEPRANLAARLREELGVEVSEHGDPGSAVDGASVVVAITRSAEPYLKGEWLSPGAHVNAVGAIVPARRELEAGVISRSSLVAADSVAQARDDSGELRAAVDAGSLAWDDVRDLSEIVDSPPESLREPEQITVFKALGVGLSDVALGAELLRRARAAGVGRPVETSQMSHS